MKKSLLLTVALLTFASTIPVRAQVSIPTAIASWTLATGGVALGALAVSCGATTTKFAIAMANHPKEESQADKDFNRGLIVVGGLISLTSAALSYLALKTAFNLIQ